MPWSDAPKGSMRSPLCVALGPFLAAATQSGGAAPAQILKVGGGCVNSACPDLCGGGVPRNRQSYRDLFSKFRPLNKLNLVAIWVCDNKGNYMFISCYSGRNEPDFLRTFGYDP